MKMDTPPHNSIGRRFRAITGWAAVAIATLAACLAGFWGAIEAFHEGWCRPTLPARLLQTTAYLAPTLVLAAVGSLGVLWPRLVGLGSVLIGAAIAFLVFADNAEFGSVVLAILIGAPVAVGALFAYGRPRPKTFAALLPIVLPTLVVLVCGAEPAWRVAGRFDDGDRSARRVEGTDTTLLWAPAGPGWTRDGLATWDQARRDVRRLSADGLTLAEEPIDVWRLPTREEIVRSLTRQNQNAGGVWDASRGVAKYDVTPDKESPLWDPLAPLIYLWTSEEASKNEAWIVVYHGGVFSKSKGMGSPSLGFRAVREPETAEP